jgi:hypothetical protein
MSLITDLRRSVTESTAVHVAVGATDLAMEKVRELPRLAGRLGTELESCRGAVRSELEERVATVRELDLRTLPDVAQARAQQAPTRILTVTLEAAGKAEEVYEGLAARGKELMDRIATQQSTHELVHQGKVTLARGKAAMTTVRKGAKETAAAGKAAVTTARREAAEVADDTRQVVATKTAGTKAATKRTATTARKRATTAKRATKTATTSARKTAAAAAKAVEESAEKIGD